MANNLEREVLRILNAIVGVEEHLRSGTYGHQEGWSTASEAIVQEQRSRLMALRTQLSRKMRYVPPAGLEAIYRLLDADFCLDREFLQAQLEAADCGTDSVSYRNIPAHKWK